MRSELVGDAARATPLAAYLVGILNGVNWPAVAAMLAALYTLILILEKLWRWWIVPLIRRSVPAGRNPADE